MTLDNAFTNIKFTPKLVNNLSLCGSLVCNGELYHIRCCAYIINLVDQSVLKIQMMIKFVIASNMKVLQIRKEKLKESANLANLDSKKGLKLDVMPRCNSTYLMLESALCYC